MSNSAPRLTKEDIAQENATRYLTDKAYQFVLGKPQSVKLRQVVKGIGVKGVTARLLRRLMAASDKFETVDRRWAASVRYGDSRRPLERVIAEIMQYAGVPVSLEALAQELGQLYERPAEHYEEVLPRVLCDTEKFFTASDGAHGLASWLVMPTSEDERDIIFDNYLSEEEVAEYTELCPAAAWVPGSEADTAADLIKKCKSPVPIKILQLFGWRETGEDFDPADFYCRIIADDRMLVLSDQKVYPAADAKVFVNTIATMAEQLAKLPLEPEEEEAEGPIQVTETDKEEMVAAILAGGGANAGDLVEAVLEVSPDESPYAGTVETVTELLKQDERVMWLGGDRWGKVETFPDYINAIPESLVVPPTTPFETPEGDVFDQELEEDGFENVLKTAVLDPLVEDVTDEDPARTIYQPAGDSQRCVLKYHHKVEGTFPLCQINSEFFGPEPEIIPITLAEDGKRKNAYVNNTTRLIYGLKDFYKSITEVSGAVFTLSKTPKPGDYRIAFEDEVEEQLAIDTGRSLELLELKAEFESSEMPLYDAIVRILEQRTQGMTFTQLVSEINIVKRCSRLVVASILSSYHAFHTRGKSKLWQYDAKKASQGFNKTKKKYIKKVD